MGFNPFRFSCHQCLNFLKCQMDLKRVYSIGTNAVLFQTIKLPRSLMRYNNNIAAVMNAHSQELTGWQTGK